MSASGTKRTLISTLNMSAFRGKADISDRLADVRSVDVISSCLPIPRTGLTRNIWDQLRALAQKRSLRIVTKIRRPLRDRFSSPLRSTPGPSLHAVDRTGGSSISSSCTCPSGQGAASNRDGRVNDVRLWH